MEPITVTKDLPAREDDAERDLDDELLESLREHICPRCHYEVDDDGYCSMCGASAGRA